MAQFMIRAILPDPTRPDTQYEVVNTHLTDVRDGIVSARVMATLVGPSSLICALATVERLNEVNEPFVLHGWTERVRAYLL